MRRCGNAVVKDLPTVLSGNYRAPKGCYPVAFVFLVNIFYRLILTVAPPLPGGGGALVSIRINSPNAKTMQKGLHINKFITIFANRFF
jgi:hypothetical protein